MRVNLFGQATEGRSKQVTSQSRVNCVIEQSPDKGEITAYQRNGTQVFSTFPSGFRAKGFGTWVTDDAVTINPPSLLLVVGHNSSLQLEVWYVKVDGTNTLFLSPPYVISPSPVGKISIGAVNKQFAFVQSAVGIGRSVYFFDSTVPAVLQKVAIANVPSPTEAWSNSIAYLDRRYYIMTNEAGTNYLRWSPIDGGTYNSGLGYNVWNSLDRVAHGFGLGLGLFTYGDMLIAFYSTGIGFYQTTSDPNNPITRVGSLLNDYRLESINSVAMAGDMLCFLGSESNRRAVYVIRGYNVERISVPDVEELFKNSVINPEFIWWCSGFFANLRGHECYVLTSLNWAIFYDFISGTWGTIETGTNPPVWQFGAKYGSMGIESSVVLGRFDSNVISVVSNELFRDNGVNNTVTLTSPVIYDETSEDRLTCTRVRIDVDYIAKGSVQPQLSISRDGGKTFGSPISCNPPGYTVDGTRINRLEFRRIGGRARDWRFRLTYTGENPLAVVDSFAEFEK